MDICWKGDLHSAFLHFPLQTDKRIRDGVILVDWRWRKVARRGTCLKHFLLDPSRGRVYKWKFCPFVRLSVCHHFLFNRYLSNGRSNPKNSKNEVHFFSNFASGRTLPTQSTGPQPIQLVPKHCFYRYLSNGRSNPKISKNEVHFF